jgi:hypothetical protein
MSRPEATLRLTLRLSSGYPQATLRLPLRLALKKARDKSPLIRYLLGNAIYVVR